MTDARSQIKKLILENYETLKLVSDCFDKINKNKDEIKDDLVKKIRDEWLNYIKNIDNDLLVALVNAMRRSMDDLKKAVIGDKSKKEPKVFIQISTYWKPSELLIDFKPDIHTVKKDLEFVMSTVTNFQENCLQLFYDPDLIFEKKEQKHF